MFTTTLDITREHCPMTFVKTKLELSKLASGDTLEVILLEGEPLSNIPKSAESQGYKVLTISHIKDNIHQVVIQK